jgi:hypothetical protein
MIVTIFKDIFSKEPFHVHVSKALDRIKSGNSIEEIEKIRGGNKAVKKQVPAVLFSGEFSERVDTAIVKHSGLIVLDFDNIDVNDSKSFLATDDYVYSCWVSPSGNGLKALVRISNPERHRDHFRALEKYFMNQYGLEVDPSGVNESRACFESYDPDLIVNDDSKVFGGLVTENSEKQTASHREAYTDYMKLNLAARMIRHAEDGEKHNVLLRASILCGGYIAAGRMEEDEVIRVLLREILKRDIDSESVAMNTIRDGIEKGKQSPLTDIINAEKDAARMMRINDGDMSFISSDDSDFRMIDDYAQGKIMLGLETGDNTLDEHWRYKKEFVVINGHSNVGKTTVMLYLMMNAAMRHGWRWLVYSSENTTWSLKMTLMEFAVDRRIDAMTYDQRRVAYKWVNDHFTVISNNEVYSYSDIIVFMEKMSSISPIDAVFIDPYNSLRIDLAGHGIGVHDYHYQAASEFLTYSASKNVAVWLNTHAVTEAQRRKGDDGLPVPPYAEDTEGGGKFVNRADCFLTIHRKVQAPDPSIRKTTEFHVRKIREVKTGGQPTPYDSPILFYMNTSMTGFHMMSTSNSLFEPLSDGYENYKTFHNNT